MDEPLLFTNILTNLVLVDVNQKDISIHDMHLNTFYMVSPVGYLSDKINVPPLIHVKYIFIHKLSRFLNRKEDVYQFQ